MLRLEEYVQPLFAQGYATVRDVTQLPWEDMEDIGIVKLGHQKKLLLAIKRVKDIMSGKWVLPGLTAILCSNQVSVCATAYSILLNRIAYMVPNMSRYIFYFEIVCFPNVQMKPLFDIYVRLAMLLVSFECRTPDHRPIINWLVTQIIDH